jgi:protein arginine N-methyltransferase 1
VYNIHHYGEMIADRGRIDAYAQALRARVTVDSVVLDIGTGPGILTLLACQAGAQKVYAVEQDGVIQVAREVIGANGYAGRVEFIQASSTAIDLPEKVDVIVSDIHGALPFFCGNVMSILDARDRFLKPGGSLVPMRDTVSVAPVIADAAYRRIVEPWEDGGGFDLTAGRRRAVNCWATWRSDADSLAVEPRVWSILDYLELRSPNARGHADWTMTHACKAHGLCLWFDCETAPGCGFSNSPLSGDEHTFSRTFFPWSDPCDLEPGDQVSVEIAADTVGESYIWSWNTEIRGSNGSINARFRQSEFLGLPLSNEWLRKSSSSFVPSPNSEASIDRVIVELLFTGITLEEISRVVSDRFPERFPEWRHALTRVGDMSRRYSR